MDRSNAVYGPGPVSNGLGATTVDRSRSVSEATEEAYRRLTEATEMAERISNRIGGTGTGNLLDVALKEPDPPCLLAAQERLLQRVGRLQTVLASIESSI